MIMRRIILVIGVVLLLSIFVYSYAAEKPVSSQPKKPAAQAQKGLSESQQSTTPPKEGAGVHLTTTQQFNMPATGNFELPPGPPKRNSETDIIGEEEKIELDERLITSGPLPRENEGQAINLKAREKEAPKP